MKKIKLFADLHETALETLAAVARSVTFRGDEVIMLEGGSEAPVFFVVEGAVRVYRTNPNGREQTLILLKPGEAFNMPTAFFDTPSAPASAQAVGATRLLAVPLEDFRRVATEAPDIAMAVLRYLSGKLHHMAELTHDLSLRSVRGRLARYLLAQPQETRPLRRTHEEIAAHIGTVREVVSRTLNAMARDGLIRIERQHITVLDFKGLEYLT